MNDRSIDDALELGITSCLHSLQNSKPSLLLNASQLKKTERDVKFIPSLASALSSIVLNCHDSEEQRYMMNIMNSWTASSIDNSEKLSIVTPENSRDNSIPFELDVEVRNSISEEAEKNRNIHDTRYYNEPIMNSDRYIAQETTNLIASKFREVMHFIGERKAEQVKQTKAEFFRRKKRHITNSENEDEDDEESNASSASGEDLDDFLTHKLTHSESDSGISSENIETNSTQHNSGNKEGRILNSDEDDFDDDEWW